MKQNPYVRLRKLKDFIKYNSLSGNKSNLFQYCKNNTKLHEHVKFRVFEFLIDNDFEVLIEPEFKKGGRPDIVCFKEGKGFIIEILNTESESDFNDKILNYPLDQYELVKIYCNKQLEGQLYII